MRKDALQLCCIFLALCVLSPDAHAWGLATHVHFANALTWSVPLAAPALSIAVRRFPAWVLAGACLPDLALFGRRCGTAAFDSNHRWQTAHRLRIQAATDEERAAAVGYCSHLFVDVIAHNHFVPCHEQRWPNVKHATHAACEWAMDVHLARHISTWPAEVLRAQAPRLVEYVSDAFACPAREARASLATLIKWESLLRRARLPEICYSLARGLDRQSPRRFDDYLAATTGALYHINDVLCGHDMAWPPEGAKRDIPPLESLVDLREGSGEVESARGC